MEVLLLKLFLAVLVGGLIGAEREFRVGMGLRTMMLICLGAALFTILSDIFTFGEGDPRRIAAAVVTGVGFLGGGMILRYQGGVFGITSAATVWLVAALGMGIGLGYYLLVALATILVLVVLWVIPRIHSLTNARKTYTYEAICPMSEEKYNQLHNLLKANGLQVTRGTVSKKSGQMTCVWRTYGKPQDHDQVMYKLLIDPDVVEFRLI